MIFAGVAQLRERRVSHPEVPVQARAPRSIRTRIPYLAALGSEQLTAIAAVLIASLIAVALGLGGVQ